MRPSGDEIDFRISRTRSGGIKSLLDGLGGNGKMDAGWNEK